MSVKDIVGLFIGDAACSRKPHRQSPSWRTERHIDAPTTHRPRPRKIQLVSLEPLSPEEASTDEDFEELFEVRGRPAIAPWRLALVTVVQFSEELSDRQAAETVSALL